MAALFITHTTSYAQEETTEKIVTLTFYSDENTIFETVSGENGVCITNKIPTKEGYQFLYWMFEKDGKMTKAPYEYIFTQDTNFYAYWVPRMQLPEEVMQNMKDSKIRIEQIKKIKLIQSRIPIITIKNTKKNNTTISINASKFEKDGYKIQYSTSKKFKKAKNITVKSTKKKLTKKIKNLKKGKTYYIRVRAYRVYDPSQYNSAEPKETFYSRWSKTAKVKLKK